MSDVPDRKNLVKSKQRVADHGEVFTPAWLVEDMINLVKDESERIDSRFLEPACGSGNFLVPVLRRKLAAVEARHGRSDFEKRHYALFAVMCIYGIELLPDNYPAFVQAAKDMHEAKLLAEGGFTGSERTPVGQRYERAEKELFARMESIGREIENRVTGTDSSRLKDRGLKSESTSAADYGSAERQEAFAASLATTGATETQIRGRLAAARSEGTHPSAAVAMGKGAAKARKSGTGAAVGAERTKSGPSR